MGRRSFRMLLMSILAITVATQPVFLLAAASQQTGPEFGFGPVGLGLYTTAFFITASLTSAPAGRLVERIGWQSSIRLTAVSASSCLLAMAAFARSTWSLAGLLMISAAFYGFANPGANLALARFVREGRRGIFFGIKHAGIPASTLLAGLAVPLINVRWGWRWAYVVAAGLGVLLFVLVPRTESEQAKSTETRRGTRQMSNRDLTRLTTAAAFITAGPGALGVFAVSAGVAAGLSEVEAGWTLSVAGLASITARMLFGRLVDRLGSDGIRPFVTIVSLGSLALVVLAFLTGWWFSVGLVIVFTLAWGWPGLLTYAVVEGNRAHPAAATARTQSGIFVGAGLGPLAFGALVDVVDFRGAWIAVAVTLLVGVAVAWPLSRRSAHAVRSG